MNNISKIPPHDLSLESAVLGALLLEKDTYMHVSNIIERDIFYDNRNALVFDAIRQLHNKNNPVDILTVAEQLKQNKSLEKAGSQIYLAELTSQIGSAINIKFHAEILKQKAIQRKIIKLTAEINEKGYSESIDIADMMVELTNGVENLMKDSMTSNRLISFAKCCDNLREDARTNYERQQNGESNGIPTGFEELDQITGGWQNSDLIILGARPAMGKTAVAIQHAKAAAKSGFKVIIFSIEMSNLQLTQRAIGGECDVTPYKMRTGSMSSHEVNSLTSCLKENKNLPIYMDDTACVTIEQIESLVKMKHLRQGVDLVIIDYLQLVTTTSKFAVREQMISHITRKLKGLAKVCNIPIIALSQLNRNVANQADKRPQLSDLRESGAIEQDADIVIFVHREAYYDNTKDDKGELLVKKHRSGAVGDTYFKSNLAMTKFTNAN